MRNDKEDFAASDPVVKHLYVGEHFELVDEDNNKVKKLERINITKGDD